MNSSIRTTTLALGATAAIAAVLATSGTAQAMRPDPVHPTSSAGVSSPAPRPVPAAVLDTDQNARAEAVHAAFDDIRGTHTAR